MRKLAPEEAALWQRVVASVKPIHAARAKAAPKPPLPEREAGSMPPSPASPATPVKPVAKSPARPPQPNPSPKGEAPNTLDGGWDRRLSRGLVGPDATVDLHGHSLATAHARLDRALEQAISQGDRLVLLVTGKPPRPESERPHARGAIRAAVGDWLAASRFADRIAAVRNAHPRHGGTGALYIVLRRQRNASSTAKS
ncbi:Smr/MutS family protein [Sphingomonas sp.]|uniref:Smr/MutS family protein n=1 Tax=Sphingomonas sp. TaxID=28214 RepID=UPI0025FC846D|nr:Smr/MutS family protein [Sphingomonas sp.]